MANEENIIKHRFKKGKSGNPNGRPKKFISTLKAEGYKASEIKDTIEVMLSLTKKELEEIENNDELTVMELTVASAVLKGIKDKNLGSIEILLSRAFGQPKQEMEIGMEVQVGLFPDVIYDDQPDDEEEKS